MISFPQKTVIPENYRRQSEISDWLPGAESLQDEYGKELIQALYKMGRGRFNRLCLDALCLFLLGIVTFAAFLTVRDAFNFLVFAILLISGIASLYLVYRVVFKGFWGNEEPNLINHYAGKKPAEFEEIVDYWKWFGNSDQPILAAVGNNERGIPINCKNREYGFLALFGNHTQRTGIFPPVLLRTKSEWWFPVAETENVIDNTKNKPNTQNLIMRLNSQSAIDIVVAMQALAFNDSNNIHMLWFDYLISTLKHCNILDGRKRFENVTADLEKQQVTIRSKEVVRRISQSLNYPELESHLPVYLKRLAKAGNKTAESLLLELPEEKRPKH